MLTYILNSDDKIPLYEQLYNYIKKDIINGNILADEKLPSKRKLAAHLKLSIITIENAYEQLLAEGYIYSKPRKGFFATKIINNVLDSIDAEINNIKYDKKSDPIKNIPTEYKFNFKTSSIDTENFPFYTWTKILREILRENDKTLLNKSEPKGIYELRYEISKFLKEFKSMNVNPNQIIVGAGSEYLINIIIQLLGTDKRYGVETPGYPKVPQILSANKIKPNYIKLDDDGIIIDKLDNIDVLHITPSHQYPLGIVTPLKRRLELLKWANDNNSYIIEDDYDSEFRYSGKPMPAMQSLDKNNRIIYLNTFTKNLAPALRISYMVLPEQLMNKYEREFQFYSNTVSRFEQHTLAKFMKNGHFERYINKMRLIYNQRLDTIIELITSTNLKNYVEIKGHKIGLHIILELKKHTEDEFLNIAYSCSIDISKTSDFYYKSNYHTPAMIMGYSSINVEDIKLALTLLNQKLR